MAQSAGWPCSAWCGSRAWPVWRSRH